MLKLAMLLQSLHMALMCRRLQIFCTFADAGTRPDSGRLQQHV